MTPFEAKLIAHVEAFAWIGLSALLFWVTGSQWALLAVAPAFFPWTKMYLDEYGRKP